MVLKFDRILLAGIPAGRKRKQILLCSAVFEPVLVFSTTGLAQPRRVHVAVRISANDNGIINNNWLRFHCLYIMH